MPCCPIFYTIEPLAVETAGAGWHFTLAVGSWFIPRSALVAGFSDGAYHGGNQRRSGPR